MAKGLLCVTLAVCLLFQASAQPFLSSLLGGSQSTGGSTSGSTSGSVSVSGSTSGSSGGLGSLIGGLVPNLSTLLNKANAAIANISQTATGTNSPLSNLNKAVVNLQTVLSTITTNTATIAVNASTKVFQETINQAKNAAGGSASPAVSTCISTAQNSLNAITPQAISTVLSCSSNIGKDATSLSAQVVAFDIGLKADLLKAGFSSVTNCAMSITSILSTSALEKCIDGALNEVQNYVIGQTNKINNAIKTTESLTTEAGKCISSGTDLVNKSGQAVVTQLKSCLSGQGVEQLNTTLNYSFYLNQAKNAIANITASAFGTNSPINNLNKAVLNLQAVIATVTPNTTAIAVTASTKIFQEFINQVRVATNGSTNPAVGACISTAQTSFNNIAPQAIKNAVNCSVEIGTKAGSLSVQAAAFDVGLKTDLALVGVKFLTNCSQNFLTLNNTFEKCFDSAVNEFKNYINGQINKINNAIATADSLTVEAGKCISAAADFAEKSGQAVVTQLRACLNGQGVSVQTSNNTAELKAGKAAIEKVAANLNGSVDFLSATSLNAQLSVNFIGSINVENLVSGSLDNVQSAVLSLEAQLSSNTNPAVKACVNSTKNRLASLRTSATSALTNCVKTNQEKVIDLYKQIAALVLALKGELDNAGVKAEENCSSSTTTTTTTASIIQQCFVDAEFKLNVNVDQAVKDTIVLSDNIHQITNKAVDCVNTELAILNASIDTELASLKSCLEKQGLTVTVSRY